MNYRLQSIRKTTIAFASLFKDIPLIKYDDNGREIERVIVPIIYGDKEKYVKRLDIDHERVQITLPRIEYGLTDMVYDSSRKLNQATKMTGCAGTGTNYINAPLPYNYNFELVLYTRNIEEANQIMEYVLSHFTPDYNLKISMVPEAGVTKNIPITFNGESEEEDATGSFDSPVRSVFRTLTFTARSFVFQPPKQLIPILMANTNVYIPSSIAYYQLTNGTGDFLTNERVFQGYSYDSASAKGTVYDWNNATKILGLVSVIGNFANNAIITNLSGSAQYVISELPGSGIAYTTSVTPTPNTYPVTGPYNINTATIDYTT